MSKKNNKIPKGTITDVDLNGMTNEVTFNTDVTSNPFPFTEEDNKTYEHVEYGNLP